MIGNKLVDIYGKWHSVSHISRVFLSNISNKRITRLLSDTEVDKSELKADGNEAIIETKLVNRNPRNLEQLLFEPKTFGFELDLPQRHYWNKVVFEKSGKNLFGKIVHYSGRVIAMASTKEIAIREQLKSTSGVNAAKSIGQILAIRALESGVIQVFVEDQYKDEKSLKVKEFLGSLKDNGITLEEQPFIFSRKRRDL